MFYRVVKKGNSIPHYLGKKGTDALSPIDLESLVIKLRNKTASQEEKDLIFNSHLRLVVFIAGRYRASEDLVSEAAFGLHLAILKAPEQMFDNKFTTYAISKMHSRIRRWLERDRLTGMPTRTFNRLKSQKIEIFQPSLLPMEILINPIRRQYKQREIAPKKNKLKELRETIEASIKNDTERKVIELREQGYKDFEISQVMGLSQSKVFNIRKQVERRFNRLTMGS